MERREKGVNGKEKEKEMEILFAVEIVTVMVTVVVTVVVSNGGRVEIFVVIHGDMWLDSAAPSTGIDFTSLLVTNIHFKKRQTKA